MAGINDFDAAFLFKALVGVTNQAITAGGAGDGTYDTNGVIHDNQSLDSPESAIIVVGFNTTVAAAEDCEIAVKLQHGDASNLSDAADYDWGGAEVDFGVVASDDETVVGALKFSAKLAGLKRYWRVAVKPTLSAASTDTCAFFATIAAGPGDESPPA